MKTKLLIILFSLLGLVTNAQLVVSVTSANICAGNCATLTASANGGTSPYNYFWNPSGNTTQTIIVCPTTSTNYTVTVMDAISSTATATGSITVNPAPTASAIANPTTITTGNSSTLTASASGGASPYTYNWSQSFTFNPIVVSPTTTTVYCVTVTDANTCTDTVCVTVYVTPTGVQSFYNDKSLSISVFPNPFSFETILLINENLKKATLTIYNTYGQEIKKIINISGQQIKLQRDNLQSGIYFIHLIQDNTTFVIKKLVITD